MANEFIQNHHQMFDDLLLKSLLLCSKSRSINYCYAYIETKLNLQCKFPICISFLKTKIIRTTINDIKVQNQKIRRKTQGLKEEISCPAQESQSTFELWFPRLKPNCLIYVDQADISKSCKIISSKIITLQALHN